MLHRCRRLSPKQEHKWTRAWMGGRESNVSSAECPIATRDFMLQFGRADTHSGMTKAFLQHWFVP